jgi:hypothetical protein
MNAVLNSKARRSQLIAALVALIEKLPGILPKATFAVAGKRVTTAQVVEEAQLLLAALNVADVARKQHHDAVVAVSELRASMKAKGTAVRAVVGTLGATSAEAAVLGFEPKTRATPTVAVKAGAIEKRAQTRVARHTMGKKQKAAIRGAPATAQSAAKKGA